MDIIELPYTVYGSVLHSLFNVTPFYLHNVYSIVSLVDMIYILLVRWRIVQQLQT